MMLLGLYRVRTARGTQIPLNLCLMSGSGNNTSLDQSCLIFQEARLPPRLNPQSKTAIDLVSTRLMERVLVKLANIAESILA